MKLPVKRYENIYSKRWKFIKAIEIIDGYFTISKIDNQEIYLNFKEQGYI